MNPQIGFLLNKALESLRNSNLESAGLYLKQALRLQSNNPHALRLLGVIAAQRKQYSEALNYLNNSLKALPKNALALSNLGNVYFELKEYDNALDAYDRSIKIDPKYEEVYSNKGNTLYELKRFDEAIAHHDIALSLQPGYAQGWTNKGNTLNELKRFDEAIAHHDRALSLKPDYVEAWSNKGNALKEIKRFDEAIAHYDKALSLNPDYAEAWTNKGNTLNELKRFDEAIAHHDRALSLKPDYVEAWSNKGNALKELKRYDEAITHYDKALSLNSDYAEAWSNKGTTLQELKYFDEAIAHYDKALSLNPGYVEGWSNKGNTLYKLKRFDEAIAHYDVALSLNPDYVEGWSNKGNLLRELKRYDEAIAHIEQVLSLKPTFDWLLGDLLHLNMIVGAWTSFSDSLMNISKRIIENQKVIQPFCLITLSDDSYLHKKSSENYVKDKYLENLALGSIPKFSKNEKIRIGYFSADFRDHAVSILTAELFELHDKNRFEIIAFSFGADDKSPIRLRLSEAFNQFIDVGEMPDLEIAKLSRDLQIDIAVDLGGHTAGGRTGIFSYRAAPIQLSYIGYLGTMGASYYDYLLADKIIIPEDLQKFYSEKITYLPSYQVNDRRRLISDRQFTRAELGLPEIGFVFCSFNNNYKILPSTFEGWIRILKAVDSSVLFLYVENKWAKTNLQDAFEAEGINSSRLVFASHMPKEENLARYRACDLFLDTFPYNAGTTASDALWAGVPVLTRMGQSFASRMATSLLNAIGLPELITNTQEEYEALAIELALNPQKLEEIKLKLANNRLTTPLFDTPLFAKNLEAAYLQMYERYQADLQPDHIEIV
jgi:protein O-GlcNAc transferase